MSAKKRRLEEDFFEDMHRGAIEDGAIELGPVSPGQNGLFERIRANITPGEVMKTTFDQALLRRGLSDQQLFRQSLPPKVSAETFDQDVQRIKDFTFEERKNFDKEVLDARMERRAPGGGVYVNPDRGAGFGSEVFGFAYHVPTRKWAMTNEMGLHAVVAEHLAHDISYETGEDRIFISDMLSGLVFKLPSIETPIITLFGYVYFKESDLQNALAEIWDWKFSIIIDDEEVASREYLWGRLFTPDIVTEILSKYKR